MKIFRIIDVCAATDETAGAVGSWAKSRGISIKEQGGLTLPQIIEFENRPVKRNRESQKPDMKEVREIMKALAIANGDIKE